MTYPTAVQVEEADTTQLARWVRFLDSPGVAFIGTPEFNIKLDVEATIMDRIIVRFNELGGMTPELSKQIGW